MLKRIWSLVIKEFIHLRNDWWMPAFMLIGGASELLLVGWATSRPITNLPLMVFDQNKSAASHQFVAALENTHTFGTAEQVESMQTIEDALNRGQISAAVVIPPDYSEQMLSATGDPTVFVILNGSENTPAQASLRAVQGVAQDIDQQLVVQRLGLSPDQFSGFNPSLRVWFNENLSEALYTTPAEMGLMLEFTVLLFAALAFSRERELGTLEQLLVMPFSSLEIIIGKSIPVVIVGFADFLLMLTHGAFCIQRADPRVDPVVICSCFWLSARRTGQGTCALGHFEDTTPGVSAGSAGRHGGLHVHRLRRPVESMPQVLQWFAIIIPAHHWLTILRGILLKGAGLDVLWPNVLALIVLGIVIGTFSLYFVRKALD